MLGLSEEHSDAPGGCAGTELHRAVTRQDAAPATVNKIRSVDLPTFYILMLFPCVSYSRRLHTAPRRQRRILNCFI
jgi:hypothetical protein